MFVEKALYEIDGRPVTLARLQMGVMPNEIVRFKRHIYMNGACLNDKGPEWGELGVPVLAGPVVNDLISSASVEEDLIISEFVDC